LHLLFEDEYEAVVERCMARIDEGPEKGGITMQNLGRNTSLRLLLLAGFTGLPLTLALGHEGHRAECNETAINALKADIQAMGAGEARTTATKEMEAAQQLMAKNDVEGCQSHIHSAMEATEK
jgi:hypothetical protein